MQSHILFTYVLVILWDLPETVFLKDLETEITLGHNLNNCQNIKEQKKSTSVVKFYWVWYVYLHEQVLAQSANFTCTNIFINLVILFLWLEGCPVTPGFSNIWTSARLNNYKCYLKGAKKSLSPRLKLGTLYTKCWALNFSVLCWMKDPWRG